MRYDVILPKPVQKQLNSLPDTIRRQVVERILRLSENPRPPGVKKFTGLNNEYRIRIGDYRVRYKINDPSTQVVILHCKHRKDVYRN